MKALSRIILSFIAVVLLCSISAAQTVPPGYYSYSQILAIADSLAQAYPQICVKKVLGSSVEGHQIFALKISDNPAAEEDEPEILFDGGIHGDEIGGSQNLIMYARTLCKSYNVISLYTDLINTRQIWLLLMVNPDGRENMVRYNGAGVDINRDFGYMWGDGGTSPYAFSQPETKILRNLMLDHRFIVYTNYHSGTEILSYPWSYRPNPSRDNAVIDTLARTYADFSGYNGLLYGQGFNIMYQINGSTKDFQYGSGGLVGWSMEISNDKQPPSSQIQTYYNYNLPSMNEMVKRSGWGIHGTVRDSLSGLPVEAVIWINDLFPVTTKAGTGVFRKYLFPGTYNVTVSANGYIPKTMNNIIVPANGSAEIIMDLAQQPGFYVSRVLGCQMLNSNFLDQGFTPGCIGASNNISYALGRNGTVTVDMGDTIYDGPGNDLRVIEGGTVQKSYYCYASKTMDGPWNLLGAAMSNNDFDLQSSGLSNARYLRITDGGSGAATGAGAGFNLDAIEMLTLPLRANFYAEHRDTCPGALIRFHDITQGPVTDRQWSFPGGTPPVSNERDPLIKYDAVGTYAVGLTVSSGYCSSSRIDTSYIRIEPCPGISESRDQEFILSPNPSDGRIFIDKNSHAFTRITVFDVTGKQCFITDSPAVRQHEFLDLSSLPEGLYLAVIQSGSNVSSKRFVIRRQ